MSEQVKLKHVELNWAFLGHPNDKGDYASGKYEVTVTLTPDQAAELKSKNLSAKQRFKEADGGNFKITLKSSKQPHVFKADGRAMTAEEMDTVGNGSIANVFATIFETRGQLFAGLGDVLVVDHKVYQGGGAKALMDDEDNSAPFELADDE